MLVAVFIARTGLEIARETSPILADRVVLDEEGIRRVVMSVPDVVGCHQIRSRGSADYAFVDLHVWFHGSTPLVEAHRLSHIVKDRLMQAYPQIADAIIHLELAALRDPVYGRRSVVGSRSRQAVGGRSRSGSRRSQSAGSRRSAVVFPGTYALDPASSDPDAAMATMGRPTNGKCPTQLHPPSEPDRWRPVQQHTG